MSKETRKTGEINAVDEKGNRYTIIKYTDFYIDKLLDGTTQKLEGLNTYQLPNGEHVNQVSETEYFAILSEITLRST